MKRAILYDYLQVRGGAESVSLSMVEHLLDSELIVSSVNSRYFKDDLLIANKIKVLQEFSRLSSLRVGRAIYGFKNSQTLINKYQQVIYSGIYAPLAINQRVSGNNIYYCHTPPRFLYDLKGYYEQKFDILRNILLKGFVAWYQPQYEQAIRQMDIVIANSSNVQSRLKNYLNIDSIVVNPPVNLEQFRFIGQSDYYISLARLEPYKQVDKIIEAFKLMPDKKLVVTSGGSEYNRLQKLATGADNISFTGWCNESELVTLLGNAISAIYLAKDEDFGMSPVESQASGKPVIGAGDGGLKETVKHKETGFLIKKDFKIEDVVNAVDWMTPNKALNLKSNCIYNSKQYGSKEFFKKLNFVIED